MRDYSKVSPAFWTGPTGRELRSAGRDAQVVALYLITGPNANMIGLYHLPIPLVAHHVGMTFEGARKALRRAFEGGFCEYDEASETVWVPEMARYQLGNTISAKDNRHKAVVKEWLSFRKSCYFMAFYEKYKTAFELPEASPFEGASKPLRSQEQEQEQEIEQEQEQEQEKTLAGGARKTFDPLSVELPFSSDSFRGAWADWVHHRASGGKGGRLTKLSAKKQLELLGGFTEAGAIESLNASIRGNWQGLFPPNGKNGSANKLRDDFNAAAAAFLAKGDGPK